MTGGLPAGPFLAASVDLGYVVWFLVIGSLMILLLLVAYVLMSRLRRRALEDTSESAPPFTMEGLENMRSSGQISDEEYRRLRRQVLGIDAGDGSSSSGPADGDDGQTDSPPSTEGEGKE